MQEDVIPKERCLVLQPLIRRLVRCQGILHAVRKPFIAF